MLGVLLEVLLGAEDTERHQHHVDVAVAVEDLADHLLVRRGVSGVEGHRLHGGGAGRPKAIRGLLQGLGPSPGEHHGATAAAHQPVDGGQGDLRTAAEHEHGLHATEGVTHGPGPPCRADGSRQSGTVGTTPPSVVATWVTSLVAPPEPYADGRP